MLKMWKMVYPVYAFLHVLSLTGAFRIMVQECPVTETAWQARSQMFECKSPKVYHCIQDNMRKLMETCMRVYSIKPYYEVGCPWASYSTYDSVLSSVFYPCEENGCPQKKDSDYWSNQLYKYPICLHYNQTTEIKLRLTKACNAINESKGIIIAIVLTAIGMNVTVILIVWNYRRRLNSPVVGGDVEENSNPTGPLICTATAVGSDVEENPNPSDPLICTDSVVSVDEEENSTLTEAEIHADARTDLTKMVSKFQGNGYQMV